MTTKEASAQMLRYLGLSFKLEKLKALSIKVKEWIITIGENIPAQQIQPTAEFYKRKLINK